MATLIGAGADIECRNYYLWTPIDCAAAYGQPKCVKQLIDVRHNALECTTNDRKKSCKIIIIILSY